MTNVKVRIPTYIDIHHELFQENIFVILLFGSRFTVLYNDPAAHVQVAGL